MSEKKLPVLAEGSYRCTLKHLLLSINRKSVNETGLPVTLHRLRGHKNSFHRTFIPYRHLEMLINMELL